MWSSPFSRRPEEVSPSSEWPCLLWTPAPWPQPEGKGQVISTDNSQNSQCAILSLFHWGAVLFIYSTHTHIHMRKTIQLVQRSQRVSWFKKNKAVCNGSGLPHTQVHGGSGGPPGPLGSVPPQTGLQRPDIPSATGSSRTHKQPCISTTLSSGVFAEQPRQSYLLRLQIVVCGLQLFRRPLQHMARGKQYIAKKSRRMDIIKYPRP